MGSYGRLIELFTKINTEMVMVLVERCWSSPSSSALVLSRSLISLMSVVLSMLSHTRHGQWSKVSVAGTEVTYDKGSFLLQIISI